MSPDLPPLISREHKSFDSYETDSAEVADAMARLALGPDGMTCPVAGCGCDYVHPEHVVVNSGGSITAISHGGTTMQAGQPSGRGACIEIYFFCEEGHRFSMRFQFHKGQTGVEILDGPSYDHEVDPIPKTLWRD